MTNENPSSPESANETSDVKAVVAKLAENWNRHDMTAFAGLFAENADFVNVIGMHWHGRQEIETKHAQTHRTIFRNSVLQIVGVIVRLVSPPSPWHTPGRNCVGLRVCESLSLLN